MAVDIADTCWWLLLATGCYWLLLLAVDCWLVLVVACWLLCRACCWLLIGAAVHLSGTLVAVKEYFNMYAMRLQDSLHKTFCLCLC